MLCYRQLNLGSSRGASWAVRTGSARDGSGGAELFSYEQRLLLDVFSSSHKEFR